MAELEAEFWGLEREQSTRVRLRRVVERMRREMLNDEGLFQVWGDEFFNKLLEDDPLPVDAVGLIHKLQTEIGELRTEVTALRSRHAYTDRNFTVIPVCEWVHNKKWEPHPWRSVCEGSFGVKQSNTCPKCHRMIVEVSHD